MSKSMILAFFLFAISQSTSAAIFKSYKSKKSCTYYEVVNKVRAESGENIYQRELQGSEEVLTDKTIYGLSLQNMTVDFNKMTASFDLIKNVTLGFNRPLLVTGARVSVDSTNKSFNKIINQVNKKITLINSVCLSDNLEIVEITVD